MIILVIAAAFLVCAMFYSQYRTMKYRCEIEKAARLDAEAHLKRLHDSVNIMADGIDPNLYEIDDILMEVENKYDDED